MKKIALICLAIISFSNVFGQDKSFPKDPQYVKFETRDIKNFWNAFDAIETSKENPFEAYIKMEP